MEQEEQLLSFILSDLGCCACENSAGIDYRHWCFHSGPVLGETVSQKDMSTGVSWTELGFSVLKLR